MDAKASCRRIENVRQMVTGLGGLPARYLRYNCIGDGAKAYEYIFAWRRVGIDDAPILYTIGLVGNGRGSISEQDQRRFAELKAGFALIKLP